MSGHTDAGVTIQLVTGTEVNGSGLEGGKTEQKGQAAPP